ncbi:MAG: PAS domain S-box protein [Elusimicrobia bacterium]|nr:PAS domain S-box protein [Elusimicrobiota bacterium]
MNGPAAEGLAPRRATSLHLARRYLLLGAFFYPAWWLIFTYLVPGAHDDLVGRVAVAGLLLAMFAATFWRDWARRHVDVLIAAACYTLITHYYLLLSANKLHVAYVEGCFIVVFGASTLLNSPRDLLWFFAYVMALTAAVAVRFHGGTSGVVLFFGLATVFVVSSVSLGSRLRLIERLAASEENVRRLFNSTLEGIALHENGVILDANDTCGRLFGCAGAELAGRKLSDLMTPEDDAAPVAVGREPRRYEAIGVRKDGARFSIEVEEKLYFYYGREVVMTAVRDISERRALENRLRVSDRLSAIGQLAAGVAHEINNPLGVILGFAQSAVGRLAPDSEIMMPLRSIERESLRCKELVQSLLTFSRQEAPADAKLDLAACVASALLLVDAQARLRGITISRELSDHGLIIVGNGNQLQQIVINLSNNAIDASPSGGAVTVSCRRVERDGEAWARLEVKDAGTGIPAGIRARIFDPFFTTKEPGRGTGLGLSLVHELTRRHRGRLEYATQEGRGTSFFADFPLA